jgi:putative ABC transport system permease protein
MLQLTLKNLGAHKRRLFSTSLAVILGVAFLSATLMLGDTMRAGFKVDIVEGVGDTAVTVRGSTRLGNSDSTIKQSGVLDASLVQQLATVDGVAEAAPGVEGVAQLIGANGRPIGGNGPPTVGTNWIPTGPLNAYRIADGREPAADGEVVIDRGAAEKGDLHVGDQTIVRTPSPTPVTIVGIATFGDRDTLGGATVTFFTTEQASELLLGQPGKVSTVGLAAKPGVSEDQLAANVAPTLPQGTEAITGTDLKAEFQHDIETGFLNFFQTLLLAFAAIALLVATFSIYNTFSIVVAQRTRESALLRALGASRRQVLRSVTLEAFVIGLIASAIGLATGFGLASGLKALMASADLDLPVSLILSTGTVIAGLVVGVGVTLVASIAPAIKASRVAPLAALRDVAVDRSGASIWRALAGFAFAGGGIALILAGASGTSMGLVGLGTLVTLIGVVLLGPVVARPASALLGSPVAILRGRAGVLARRNSMRNPRRTAGTASALLIGVAVVAAFTVLAASIKASIGRTANRSVTADLVVAQTNFSAPGLDPGMVPVLEQLPELDTVASGGDGFFQIDGTTQEPVVIDTTKLGKVADMELKSGSLDTLPADGIAVQEDYAKDHGWKLGTTIPVTWADGTTSNLSVDALYGVKGLFGDMIITPSAYLPHVTQPTDVVILMTAAPGVSLEQAKTAVQQVADRFYAPDVQTRGEYLESVNKQIDQSLAFIYGLLAIAILIAVMGIGNTISLSVHERTRELGLLRAIGQGRRQTRTMVRWESVIVAVFGTLGGIALGTFAGWATVRAIGEGEGFNTFSVPVTRLLVVVGLGAVAGVIAARRPAKRAAKLDVLQAIATD